MKRGAQHRHFDFRTFILMTVYLFIVATHLFFVPDFLQDNKVSFTLKRNSEFLFNLIRTNKCLINENKKSDQAAKLLLSTSVLSNNIFGLASFIKFDNCFTHRFVSNHHFSYLSNRILRI
jgi:hypothetical protein